MPRRCLNYAGLQKPLCQQAWKWFHLSSPRHHSCGLTNEATPHPEQPQSCGDRQREVPRWEVRNLIHSFGWGEVHGHCYSGYRSRQERVCLAWLDAAGKVVLHRRQVAGAGGLAATVPDRDGGLLRRSPLGSPVPGHGHTVRLMVLRLAAIYRLSGSASWASVSPPCSTHLTQDTERESASPTRPTTLCPNATIPPALVPVARLSSALP